MSDQEKPEINVVDRRRAAQEPQETASENRETTAPQSPAENEGEASSADSTASNDETSSPDQATRSALPDPASLLAMASMHLSTGELLMTLLSVFDGHAWRNMGMVQDHNGEVKRDLPSAQLAIDCLTFSLGKIETQLEETDRREVQRRLTDLRMNYLAKLREE